MDVRFISLITHEESFTRDVKPLSKSVSSFKFPFNSDPKNKRQHVSQISVLYFLNNLFDDVVLERLKAARPRPNTTNSLTAKPDKGHALDISKTHVSIFKAAPVAPPRTNTDRRRTLASANTITRGPFPDKGPTPATDSRKQNTRKP
ncbi:hypothetical protein Tco_1526865 [Tanacetum coccineum]